MVAKAANKAVFTSMHVCSSAFIKVYTLENANSIGKKSGEHGGRVCGRKCTSPVILTTLLR